MERKRGHRTLSAGELARLLAGLHGQGYGRYREIRGSYAYPAFTLEVEKVQVDPYAPPTRLAVHLPAAQAGLPAELYRTPVRRRAIADHLARRLADALARTAFAVDAGGQEVLDRSACQVTAGGDVVLRLGVDLPGPGRRIDGRQAERLLCRALPEAVATLRWSALDAEEARRFVATVEDADALRRMLPELGLVAFVADGAVLPRRSGVDPRPLTGPHVVRFSSPPSLRVEVELPNAGRVTGMGLPEGVTLIVGGGFHGKSTLLRALEYGVYDHVPGDGRELVVTRYETVKIRAEDGRQVTRTDVSPFVAGLPTGEDTADFSTPNASGSTSQAANIVEALEAGARVLLVDEDTAATNLMIRDARMQELVAKEREPLTPFVDLVQPLYAEHGVSTVLVMGGSGDYFDVADKVVIMDAFQPRDVTADARAIAERHRTGRVSEAKRFPAIRHRVPDPDSLDPVVRGKSKIKARGTDALQYGDAHIDLGAVEQLVDPSQVTGVGLALARLRDRFLDGRRTLAEALDRLEAELASSGIDALRAGYAGDLAAPRRFEVAAALNRLRGLRIAGFRE
ncbi:Isopentenyl-diphosphate delta-isomerase [Carbonactinospora thermoautotrophica]|uniref:Isopentenyl-diphosphate delta-isomerase n=1 Tax=Carbonactinospora thermoautotrophica TaxID=1469144 RepID=A0A132MW86_9ACTN|nr:ABC-ATPase domain-containing protein [Carbonactinospora thermoautotrophica]KWX02129.1 Isopentenyl-diphosphate delta-isomerase [Carbonactinospora thermoautotrophica]